MKCYFAVNVCISIEESVFSAIAKNFFKGEIVQNDKSLDTGNGYIFYSVLLNTLFNTFYTWSEIYKAKKYTTSLFVVVFVYPFSIGTIYYN
jgi:hypothetical protein